MPNIIMHHSIFIEDLTYFCRPEDAHEFNDVKDQYVIQNGVYVDSKQSWHEEVSWKKNAKYHHASFHIY